MVPRSTAGTDCPFSHHLHRRFHDSQLEQHPALGCPGLRACNPFLSNMAVAGLLKVSYWGE